MTKATKPSIDLGFNAKPKAKEKQNILEEVNVEETIEVESEDIILDVGGDKGMWTMSGYQGAKKPESKKGVKGVVISHEEKKKEKTLFSGFEMKKKKPETQPKTPATIVNSTQTNKILKSGGIGSEDIFSSDKKSKRIESKPIKKQEFIDEEQKKKKEKEKRERALASDLFSGMTSRTKLKKTPTAPKKANNSVPLYQVKPRHMSLEDYEEVWEDLDHKLEGMKECSSLVTVKWLRGIITNGLKFAIVSEENEDLIAAGEEKGILICLYMTFDSDDNTVEYTVATKHEQIGKKVKNRIEVLLM